MEKSGIETELVLAEGSCSLLLALSTSFVGPKTIENDDSKANLEDLSASHVARGHTPIAVCMCRIKLVARGQRTEGEVR